MAGNRNTIIVNKMPSNGFWGRAIGRGSCSSFDKGRPATSKWRLGKINRPEGLIASLRAYQVWSVVLHEEIVRGWGVFEISFTEGMVSRGKLLQQQAIRRISWVEEGDWDHEHRAMPFPVPTE